MGFIRLGGTFSTIKGQLKYYVLELSLIPSAIGVGTVHERVIYT